MRHVFRRTKEEGIINTFMLLISVPLELIRDYTVPIGEAEAWDRKRAAVVPMTLVFSFLFLNGSMKQSNDKYLTSIIVGCSFIIPGAIIGVFIMLKTKVSEAPKWLITLYSFLCFIMAIMWI